MSGVWPRTCLESTSGRSRSRVCVGHGLVSEKKTWPVQTGTRDGDGCLRQECADLDMALSLRQGHGWFRRETRPQ